MPESFLVARLTLKYGTLARFSEIMSAFVPAMEAQGWQLLGSYRSLIGDLTEVVNVWRVDDANASIQGRLDARKNPETAAVMAQLSEVVDGEVISLMEKTSFSR